MRSWLGTLMLLAGCYQPTVPEAPCSADGTCPAGLFCDPRGLCVHEPGGLTDGSIDGEVDPDSPDAAADTRMFDAPCGVCNAGGTAFDACSGPPVQCPLGCVTGGGDHCAQLVPANAVNPALTAGAAATTLGGTATFDTGTGAITGSINRAAVVGVSAGIGYFQVTSGGVPMGVFTFSALTIAPTGTARFTGSRSAVFLADGVITVDGTIDLSASCYGTDRTCAGPGGTAGSRTGAPASGGCAATNGATSLVDSDDGGGGGGGGGDTGRAGGAATNAAGGAGGAACIPPSLLPLRGGGGGGAGGPGASAFPPGGGGGGAIQMTSQVRITINGVIVSAGAGGNGGNTLGGSSASAGSGGGGGGGVLLEAPTVQVITGTVAANGGSGGGGGNSGTGPGTAGVNGGANAIPAAGGAGTASPGPGNGGNGGAGALAAVVGGTGTNGGGGGGGRGVIHFRSTVRNLGGTISPPPTVSNIVTQ